MKKNNLCLFFVIFLSAFPFQADAFYLFNTKWLARHLLSGLCLTSVAQSSGILHGSSASDLESSHQLKMYWHNGHAAVALNGDDKLIEAVGFSAGKDYLGSGKFLGTVTGEIDDQTDLMLFMDDAMESSSPIVKVDLNEQQAKNVIDRVQAHKKSCDEGCHYHLFNNNCIDFVQDIYQTTGANDTWLEHIPNDEIAKNSGVRSTYVSLFKKPYNEGESLSTRAADWLQNRAYNLVHSPIQEITQGVFFYVPVLTALKNRIF